MYVYIHSGVKSNPTSTRCSVGNANRALAGGMFSAPDVVAVRIAVYNVQTPTVP